MILMQLAILLLVAVSGTAVVFARDPSTQPVGIGFFGLVLTVMFMAFQAPDVALSQIVIGTVGLPLMILLALAKMRRDSQLREKSEKANGATGSRP
jgi:energy-converting hydrogenase B subunit D